MKGARGSEGQGKVREGRRGRGRERISDRTIYIIILFIRRSKP